MWRRYTPYTRRFFEQMIRTSHSPPSGRAIGRETLRRPASDRMLTNCPLFFKQFLDLRRIERAELMYEPDARVELRKTSDRFLDARHAYEHHASRALVKH